MGLEATGSMSGDEEVRRRVGSAVTEIDRVIRDLRNYIFGLRPGLLADRELDEALHHLAQDVQEKTGITVVVDIDPRAASQLAGKAGDVLQIAREALSNAGRHSGAETCRVRLGLDEHGAVLEIEDDGKGFEEAAVREGQGVPNLRARAE